MIAEWMISNTDWDSLMCASGPASEVGIEGALMALLSSREGEDWWCTYMTVENEVVSQRNLTPSASRVIEIAFASFLCDRSSACRCAMFNLIDEVARASEMAESLIGDEFDIYRKCWRHVNDGLWLMAREMVGGSEAAADIVEVISPALHHQIKQVELSC